MHLHKADLLAVCVEVIHCLLNGIADRAHCNHNILRIRRAIIVEGLIICAKAAVDLVHVVNGRLNGVVIVGVAGLACLEEDIRVLSGTAQYRMLRVQGAAAECVYCIPVKHFTQRLIIPNFDLLDLMRGAETIEEMQEGHAALNGGQMSHSAEIHHLLRAVRAEHRIAGLAAGINIGMITKNVQRMCGNAAGGNIDDARQQLASDLIHIRDHQKKALGCGVGRGERAGCKGAVNSACRAALRLHFSELYLLTEQVFLAGCGHLIGLLRHHGRRRDRVNSGNFGERIGYVCRGAITVHGLGFSCHTQYFLLLIQAGKAAPPAFALVCLCGQTALHAFGDNR